MQYKKIGVYNLERIYMWEILIISVPVFYIIGVIATIRSLVKGKNVSPSDRIRVLEEVIQDLKKIQNIQGVKLLIAKYATAVRDIKGYAEDSTEEKTPAPEPQPIEEQAAKKEVVQKKPEPPPIDLGKLWGNWYSNNSINLLLYIGAFLIVASASIYLGFQWGSIASSIKAIFFSFITLAFLICGLAFYRIKVIKSAGFAFISIAAILVPFNGVAWYNFYLNTQGIEPGQVWLVTSIVSIATYLFLTYYLRKSAFTYVSSAGVLSLVLSVVNVFHLAMEFYILGGVFAAFLFLFSGRVGQKNTEELFQEPLSVSAQVTLPLSLIFGLYFAIDKGLILSYPTAISLFLSAFFYLLSFTFERKIWYLVGTQILLPASVYIFLRSSHIPISQAVIMVQAIPFIYLPIRRFIQDKDQVSINATNIIALGLAFAGVAINTSTYSFNSIGTALAIGILSLHFLVAYFVEKKAYFLTTAAVLYPFALFSFLGWVGVSRPFIFMVMQIVSMLYLGASYVQRDKKEEGMQLLYVARVLMPCTGILGAMTSFMQGNYFGNIALIALLGFIFYVLCFFYTRGRTFVIAGGMVFPIAVYFTARFAGLPILTSLNTVQVIGVLYMGASVYAKKTYKEGYEIVQTLANILLPTAAILISIISWTTTQSIFVPQVVFSVFSGLLYYALSYYITRQRIYFLLSEVVFLWFIFVASRWMMADLFTAFIIVNFASAILLGVGFALKNALQEESELSVALSTVASVVVFCISFAVFGTLDYRMFYLSLFPFIYSIASYIHSKFISYFYSQLVFEIVSVYLLVFQVLPFSYKYETLGVIYAGVGCCYYALSSLFSKDKKTYNALLIACASNGVVALLVTLGVPKVAGLVCFINAALLFINQLIYKKPYGIFAGSVVASLGVYFSLIGWNVPSYIHPFIYQAVFIVLYGAFLVNPQKTKDLRSTGLIGSFISVLCFFFVSQAAKSTELSSLITAYFLTVLFAFDAWYVKEKYFGYFASAIGMGTYFWQVHFLGYSEYQVYLLPLGVYFLVLSFLTRNEKNKDIPSGLEYGGLFILLVPLLFQCFGKNGMYYSLLFALEGAGLLVPGITLQKKSYRYAGIAAIMSAVFSQTYSYVFGLPRWVITAVGGLAFIIVAIFLLLRRKDEGK